MRSVTRHAIHRYVFKDAISQIIHVRSLDSQINQTLVPTKSTKIIYMANATALFSVSGFTLGFLDNGPIELENQYRGRGTGI